MAAGSLLVATAVQCESNWLTFLSPIQIVHVTRPSIWPVTVILGHEFVARSSNKYFYGVHWKVLEVDVESCSIIDY